MHTLRTLLLFTLACAAAGSAGGQRSGGGSKPDRDADDRKAHSIRSGVDNPFLTAKLFSQALYSG